MDVSANVHNHMSLVFLPSSAAVKRLRNVGRRLHRVTRQMVFRYRQREPFTLIACNCWGAEAYRELGRPYLTPFVGLFVPPESFVRFCARVEHYMAQPLRFIEPGSGIAYPVAYLDDVEIHFVHYVGPAEAAEKWERRKKRMLPDPARRLFMFCDRDGCTPEHIARFDMLPLAHKVCFTAKPYAYYPSVACVWDYIGQSCVADGPKLYQATRRRFDLAGWLNGGSMRPIRT